MSVKKIPFSLKIILDIVFIYSIHKFQQNKEKGTRKDRLIEIASNNTVVAAEGRNEP